MGDKFIAILLFLGKTMIALFIALFVAVLIFLVANFAFLEEKIVTAMMVTPPTTQAAGHPALANTAIAYKVNESARELIIITQDGEEYLCLGLNQWFYHDLNAGKQFKAAIGKARLTNANVCLGLRAY